MKRTAHYLVLAILTGILLLPLYDQDWGGTPLFSKAVIFQGLVLLAAALWLPLARASASYRPDWRHPLVLAATALLAVNFVSAVAGVDLARSLWSTIIRMTGVFALAHLWLYFLMLTVFLRRGEERRLLVLAATVASAAVGVLAVREFATTHSVRVMTVLDNAGFLGGYAVVGFWLCLYAAVTERRGWRWFAAAGAALSAVAVVLSGSRGPTVGLLASLLAVGLAAALMTVRRRAVRLTLALAVAAVIAAGALGWSWSFSSTGRAWVAGHLPQTANRLLYANVGEDRLALWQIGWQAFQQRPWLGWGPENFQSAFDYLARPLGSAWMLEAGWYDRPHNLIIERLANLGLLGGLATLAVWWALAVTASRRWRERHTPADRLALLAVLGALLAYGLHVVFLFEVPSVSIMMLFALALLARSPAEEAAVPVVPPAHDPRRLTDWPFVATLAVGLTIIWYGSVAPARQVAAFERQYGSFLDGDYSATPFATVLDARSPAQRDLIQKFIDRLRYAREDQPVAPTAWLDLVRLAVRVADREAGLAPNDYRTTMVAAVAHRLAAEYDAAEAKAADVYLDRAERLSPERLKAFEERGELRLAAHEDAAAAAAFRQALSHTAIADQQGRLHSEIALALLNQSQLAEAKREFRAAVANRYSFSNDLRLLSPLAKALVPGAVDPYWQAYVDGIAEPWASRRTALSGRAVVYAKAGATAKAEAFLEALMYQDAAAADDLEPLVRQYLKAARQP